MKSLFWSLLLVGSIFSMRVKADERGFYLGAGATWSIVEETYIDEDSLGFKVFSGFEFNRFIGVEASYNNLGTFGSQTDISPIEGFPVEISSEALASSIVLSFPSTERFILFAKFGFYYHNDELSFRDLDLLMTTVDEDQFDFLGGIGTRFIVTEHVSLRGEWERFKAGKADVDTISMGVHYRF